MRRVAKFTISILLAVSAGLSMAYAADDISVILNGEKVVFMDTQPIIYEERTLIPVRAVFEKAGWQVDWDAGNNMAIIGNDKNVVFITINDKCMQLYDINTDTQEEIELEVPAMIIDERTMIPLRAVCEAMGTSVEWDGNTQTVYIKMEG